MMDWTEDEEIRQILDYVLWYRKRCRISASSGHKPELSCFEYGEFHNLLFRQLCTTPEFTGDWESLKDREIRQGVLAEISKDARYRKFLRRKELRGNARVSPKTERPSREV